MNSKQAKVVIAVPPGAADWGISEFASLKDVAQVVHKVLTTEEALIETAHDTDVIVVAGDKCRSLVTRNVLSRLERIKAIITSGVGCDQIDIEAATEMGICVAVNTDFCTSELAEQALALILSAARLIPLVDRSMRQENWHALRWKEFGPLYRLKGKVAGIIGFGRSGREVAVRLKAFGLRVIAYDHHSFEKQDIFELIGIEAVELPLLLHESDVITIHAPLTEKTFHLIGERELNLMKPTAILVNTSRGGIIDEKALYRALRDRKIMAAGLDVLEEEPFSPDNALAQLDNVVLTPHMAAASVESDRQRLNQLIENIRRVLRGERPVNAVNHPLATS